MVLDEPTAALDAETEHELFERYADAARARVGRTDVGGITCWSPTGSAPYGWPISSWCSTAPDWLEVGSARRADAAGRPVRRPLPDPGRVPTSSRVPTRPVILFSLAGRRDLQRETGVRCAWSPWWPQCCWACSARWSMPRPAFACECCRSSSTTRPRAGGCGVPRHGHRLNDVGRRRRARPTSGSRSTGLQGHGLPRAGRRLRRATGRPAG